MPPADFMLAWETADISWCCHWFSPWNDIWETDRNSILMTCHYLGLSLWTQMYLRLSLLSTAGYPDLGSASDWSCHMANFLQTIRCTTQIWVVMYYQGGISVLVSQTWFGGKTSRGVAKCHLSLLTKGFLFITPSFGSVNGGDFT